MERMFVTLEAFQPEASRDASEQQPENMDDISVTQDVSQSEA